MNSGGGGVPLVTFGASVYSSHSGMTSFIIMYRYARNNSFISTRTSFRAMLDTTGPLVLSDQVLDDKRRHDYHLGHKSAVVQEDNSPTDDAMTKLSWCCDEDV